MIDPPLYIIALCDTYQGFDMPNIETSEGVIGVLPAIGTEAEARMAIRALARTSGLPVAAFRVMRYELAGVMEG